MTVGIVSWLVFVVDFVVHERLLEHYLSTRLVKFDLAPERACARARVQPHIPVAV